jgi:hypothetical protein
MSHIFHPDSHQHGLRDDCPRCVEHSAAPFLSLDDENLIAIYTRCVNGLPARSRAERRAMDAVEDVLYAHAHLMEAKARVGEWSA